MDQGIESSNIRLSMQAKIRHVRFGHVAGHLVSFVARIAFFALPQFLALLDFWLNAVNRSLSGVLVQRHV